MHEKDMPTTMMCPLCPFHGVAIYVLVSFKEQAYLVFQTKESQSCEHKKLTGIRFHVSISFPYHY